MGGIVGAALAGAFGGAGMGLAENAKNDMLRENQQLKADLDEKRDRLLASLTAERDQRTQTFQAGENATERNFKAGESALERGSRESQHSETIAETKRRTDEEARHNKAAEANQYASLQVQRELSKNAMQVGEDGVLYQVTKDEKGQPTAKAVEGPNGEPLKVSKNLDEATAKKITSLTKLIDQSEANLAKTMLPKQQEELKQRLEGLYQQLSEVTGIQNPMAKRPSANRPPLTSYMAP
jgi:hypothetical protein